MKTFKRIANKDFLIEDSYGTEFKIIKGKEYRTSGVDESAPVGPKPEKDTVVVFSKYWVNVPIDVFI